MKRWITRRSLLQNAAALTAVSSTVSRAEKEPTDDNGPGGSLMFYAGTYTPNGQGIYLMSLDLGSGALTQVKVAAAIPSPSWMAIHPNGKFLYALNEISNFNGTTTGSVTAFSIDRTTGTLTQLNVVSSAGSGPAHLSVDPMGQFVFVANYGGGSFAVLPIHTDGSLGNATFVQQDTGSVGPTKATNGPPGSFAISGHDAPHAHMIQTDPAGKFVFGADLGQDRIYSWQLNRTAGTLVPNSPAWVSLPPGDGPRHFAFHPNGLFFYSLQEEASTVTFFQYAPSTGTLSMQQRISSLPAAFEGTNFTSEVRVSSDGRYLFAANRLHDTISFFQIGSDGRLTWFGEVSTEGDYPRSFTIDPTGNYLICCNQRSDALTTFRVRQSNGQGDGQGNATRLSFTGLYKGLGNPAVVVFL